MIRKCLVTLCLGSLLMVALVGCGGSKATLKGKATIDGQPFVGTLFVTNLTTNETASSPVSEKDGSFLVTNAPLGKVKIYAEPTPIPRGGSMPALPPGVALPPDAVGKMIPAGTLPPKGTPAQNYPPHLKGLAENPELRDALEVSVKLAGKFRNSKETPVETEIKAGKNELDVPLQTGEQPAPPPGH